jgi:hypothetical protein
MMKTRGYLAIALALVLGACNYSAGGDGSSPPQAWIDQPLEGSQFLIGDQVPIQWHASGEDGLRRVEVRVNGEILDTADALDGDLDPDLVLVQGQIDWSPAEAGEYLIQVLPTGPDDAEGAAAENRVQVFEEGGTVAGMVAKDLNLDGDSDDEGEGPLEGATVVVVYCGDKRSMVTTAGGTFEITDLPLGFCVLDAYKDGWFFAGTFPAGLDFPIHFSPNPQAPIAFTVYLSQEATPTPEPTATRTPPPFIPTVPPVIATPKIPTLPAPDTQDPPIPTIISPKDNVMLGCLEDIVLRWKPVSDASGIDVYEVELYVSHDNGGSWQGAGSWSLDQFTNLDVSGQTDCGLAYLWKVRARDNAGNAGGWGMTTFAIGID